jgi:peptidoglycan/LPS O-acetylase OafA/YrhL
MEMARENKPLTSIRGFAALWVVTLHLVSPSSGGIGVLALAGYTAVDLFFILSGLILAHVHAELSSTGIAMFWLRRACRVYPLHIVSSLALLAILALPDISVITSHVTDIFSALLLVHPFAPMPARPLANPPSWSIGVEIACYLLFPLLIAGFRPVRSRLAQLALVVALLGAEGLVQVYHGGQINGVGALMRGFVGFLLGMALWRLGREIDIRPPLLSLGEGASLVGMVGAALLGMPAMVPLFAALLLFCLMFDAGVVARFLRRPTCLWLGRISFSIYLLHFIVYTAAIVWFPARMMPIRGGVGRTLWEIALIATVLGLSTLTYRYIEVPGRRIPGLIAARKSRSGVAVSSPGTTAASSPSTAPAASLAG